MTIKQSHPAMSYLEQNMTGSRAVRNSANFLIRNGYTALSKKPYERTRSERCILVKVGMCLHLANQKKYEAYQKKLAAGKEAEYKLFSIPDTDHRMISYGQIDAILNYSEDPAYYSCTSQVNQQAIKKTCLSGQSFAALTAFCVLKWVASKYGIAVDLQEESYTSKADCLAGDAILVYGKYIQRKVSP